MRLRKNWFAWKSMADIHRWEPFNPGSWAKRCRNCLTVISAGLPLLLANIKLEVWESNVIAVDPARKPQPPEALTVTLN